VLKEYPTLRFFGAVETGQDMHWWDYGRLELYLTNNLLATESSASAQALRHFLGAANRVQQSDVGPVAIASTAVVLGCSIRGGTVGPHAVLVNVNAPYVDVDDVVLVNVSSHRPIVGKKGVLYNVVDTDKAGSLCAGGGEVRADVFVPGQGQQVPEGSPAPGRQIVIRSTLDTDGGKAWKQKLAMNEYSFEGVHTLNKDVDVSRAQELAASLHRKMAPLFVGPNV